MLKHCKTNKREKSWNHDEKHKKGRKEIISSKKQRTPNFAYKTFALILFFFCWFFCCSQLVAPFFCERSLRQGIGVYVYISLDFYSNVVCILLSLSPVLSLSLNLFNFVLGLLFSWFFLFHLHYLHGVLHHNRWKIEANSK